MMLITGPLFSGKQQFAKEYLGCDDLSTHCALHVENLAPDCANLPALAEELSHYPVVIATEIGGGVVPIHPAQRHQREQAGRLACLLAERADVVVRVFCGIPTVIKGELP